MGEVIYLKTIIWQPSLKRTYFPFEDNSNEDIYIVPGNQKSANLLSPFYVLQNAVIDKNTRRDKYLWVSCNSSDKYQRDHYIVFADSKEYVNPFDIDRFPGIPTAFFTRIKISVSNYFSNENNYRKQAKVLFQQQQNKYKSFRCIFHDDKNPSATISLWKNNIYYKCFSTNCNYRDRMKTKDIWKTIFEFMKNCHL